MSDHCTSAFPPTTPTHLPLCPALPALPLAFPIPSAFPFQISLSISPRRVAFIPLKLALPLLLPPFLLLLPLASANCILMFHSFNVYFHLLLHSAILIELRNFFFVCILNRSLSHSLFFSISISLPRCGPLAVFAKIMGSNNPSEADRYDYYDCEYQQLFEYQFQLTSRLRIRRVVPLTEQLSTRPIQLVKR